MEKNTIGLALAMLVAAGALEAAPRNWTTESATGPRGGAWGRAVASDGSRIGAARGPEGARGVAWQNTRTGGRGAAVEGRAGRQAAAWSDGERAAWGMRGPEHARARVVGPRGTAVVANDDHGARVRVNGQDGFVWGHQGSEATTVVGAKKGVGLYRAVRPDEGQWSLQKFDVGEGGWSDLGGR